MTVNLNRFLEIWNHWIGINCLTGFVIDIQAEQVMKTGDF